MNRIPKIFIIACTVVFAATFMPTELSQGAIFEGTVTEEGLPFGLCLDDPDHEACAGIDCNSPAEADNPLCISEAAAGTGIAKGALEGTGITHTEDFGDFVLKVVNFTLPYIALAAFVGYVVAGFLYVTAFGNEEQIQKAKKILIWSSIGLVIVVLSYAITQLLTRELVEGLGG